MELTTEERIYLAAKTTGVLLIVCGFALMVLFPLNLWSEPMKSALIMYDRVQYIFGFMIMGAVSGYIGIFVLFLNQKKIYWLFSLLLFITGLVGINMYGNIKTFFSIVDKKSVIDMVFGRNKFINFSTFTYIVMLFTCSVVLIYVHYKYRKVQSQALEVQGHKVKSKLPSGKEGKKKKKSRS